MPQALLTRPDVKEAAGCWKIGKALWSLQELPDQDWDPHPLMLMTTTFGLCLVTAAGTLCYNSKEKLILCFQYFIYLFLAVSVLHCSMWPLCCGAWASQQFQHSGLVAPWHMES